MPTRVFLLAVFCLAVAALAEPGRCILNPRPCEDEKDAINAERLPDSLRATLQQKLDSDTGFVFWGTQKNTELASQYYSQTRFHDSITTEQKNTFLEWKNRLNEKERRRLDSAPEDLKSTFIGATQYTAYAFIKAEYTVKKVYNRETKTWIDPPKGKESFTRFFLVHDGPVVEANPPKLKADIGLEFVDPDLERIFFQAGRSPVIEPSEFKNLATIASKPGTYLPYHYTLEISKDMSPVYKKKILDALSRGDRDAIRENMAKLDTFLVYADGRFFYSKPYALACHTKQLMNAYLRTFEDGLDCDGNGFMDDSERITFELLKDSVKAMHVSGELEKELANRSSGDRAFWRILGATLATKDQDERNEIVTANVDSIKKVEQREFVLNSFYKGWDIGLTAEIGVIGGGWTFGLGDTHDYFPNAGTFDLSLEFFYDKFGGGYNMRIFSSDKFNGDTTQSICLLDLYGGFRTFMTSYVENRIFAGPTILFSDLMGEDNKTRLESHVGVGFFFGTAFDFYFTKYKSDGQLRLGLRLSASINNYYTDTVKGSDGGMVSITFTPLLQGYGKRDKKYGE